MKKYGGIVYRPMVLVGDEWSVSCTSCFTTRKGAPGTRTCMDDVKRRKIMPYQDEL
jgi:hypothetical protein